MRPKHNQLFTAAVMAAMGLSSAPMPAAIQARGDIVIPVHKAPAPAKKGESMEVERLLCSGRTKARARKAWPYSGKNRTQRARMIHGFQSF